MYEKYKNIKIIKIVKNMNYGTYTQYQIKIRVFFLIWDF